MANNYSLCTVSPNVPKDAKCNVEQLLLNEHVLEVLEDMGVEEEEFEDWIHLWTALGGSHAKNSDGSTYLYAEEGSGDGLISLLLQLCFDNQDTIPYLLVGEAWYCSKMRPGEFGGTGIFVTKDGSEGMSTDWWLEQKKDAFLKHRSHNVTANEFTLCEMSD